MLKKVYVIHKRRFKDLKALKFWNFRSGSSYDGMLVTLPPPAYSFHDETRGNSELD